MEAAFNKVLILFIFFCVLNKSTSYIVEFDLRFHIHRPGITPDAFSHTSETFQDLSNTIPTYLSKTVTNTTEYNVNFKLHQLEPDTKSSIRVWVRMEVNFFNTNSNNDTDHRAFFLSNKLLCRDKTFNKIRDTSKNISFHQVSEAACKEHSCLNGKYSTPPLVKNETFNMMCLKEKSNVTRFVVVTCTTNKEVIADDSLCHSAQSQSDCVPIHDGSTSPAISRNDLDAGYHRYIFKTLNDYVSLAINHDHMNETSTKTIRNIASFLIVVSSSLTMLQKDSGQAARTVLYILTYISKSEDEIHPVMFQLQTLRYVLDVMTLDYPLELCTSFEFQSKNMGALIKNESEFDMNRNDIEIEIRTLSNKDIKLLMLTQNERITQNMNFIKIPFSAFLNCSTIQSRVGVFVSSSAFLFWDNYKINTRVYSIVTPYCVEEGATLVENITFGFVVEKDPSVIHRHCVHWATPKGRLGDWSKKGCTVVSNTNNMVTCSCNHLSHFTLMDEYSLYTVLSHDLEWVYAVCILVSSSCLVMTLFTYFYFNQLLNNAPARILVLICVNLLTSDILYTINISFVFQNTRKSESFMIWCNALGTLLHLSLLSSLCLMGGNGYYMYKALVQELSTTEWIVTKLSVFAFGIPSIIVGITAVVNSESSYIVIANEFCWLNLGAFIFGFAFPVFLILAFNVTVFSIVFSELQHLSEKTPVDCNVQIISRQLKGTVSITCFLCVNWTLALCAIGPGKNIFSYLFVISNSLLGCFIFIFYCFMQDKTRYFWRIHFQRFLGESAVVVDKERQNRWIALKKNRAASVSAKNLLNKDRVKPRTLLNPKAYYKTRTVKQKVPDYADIVLESEIT